MEQTPKETLKSGISPTYYTQEGKVKLNPTENDGSPVHGDQSRVFYSHPKECNCRGSGIGCECTNICSCKK
ncbi:unnamed protein product [Rhizopus stolonifer]